MSEKSVSKKLTALNGGLVGEVYRTEWEHQENSWHYDVLARVPDGVDKLYGRREKVIDGKRYVVVASEGGYKKRSFATQHCVIKLTEIIDVLTANC